ncbi:MAG: HAMP domain-containing histidine kinase [Saprospiraceae bacterium]|nr:HAMP domain-containing histidine kinase [Saprospiraceae bacterium]
MRLSAKTNRYYLVFILLLFPLMMVVDYFVIKYYVYSEVNEMLQHESNRINYYLSDRAVFPASDFLFDTAVVHSDIVVSETFTDTLFYEDYANQQIPYRMYQFSVSQSNHQIVVRLRHVLLEMRELIGWIFAYTALIISLLIVGHLLINRRISRLVWKPFFEDLGQLKKYGTTSGDLLELKKSNIVEFDTLNKIIETLTNQISEDFQKLKNFNEQVSHEMQNPLATIRNKMVLLLGNQHLDDNELNWAQVAYHETNKLSKIVKSLTLISRIENNEFKRLEKVDVLELLENIMRNIGELIEYKGLEVTLDLYPARIKCDPILANILFTNLIKNAVQHNTEGGYIKMFLNPTKFEIENTGEVLETKTDQLFHRFEKGNMLSDSLGLGLSINQRICEMYGFKLHYHHHNGRHKIELVF